MAYLCPSKIEFAETKLPDKDHFKKWLETDKPALGLVGAEKHTSSPFCYHSTANGNRFIGGCDALTAFVRSTYLAPASGPQGVPQNEPDGVTADGKYDYDLVVVGGGSGGMPVAKAAADLGAKVACMDFVKPSTQGTTWGLGGTCVNVGCIPKKLCHRASILGEDMKHDAGFFGWDGGANVKHDWAKLTQNVKNYIMGLNFKYRVALRTKGVNYINKLATLVDDHTIQATDKAGEKTTITAGRIVIAVGGRPKHLDCPGHEHAIDSDDLFMANWAARACKEPGKTLVVGASYVALECAGFLTGLGYDATVMVRSVILRGYDREYSDKIADYMEQTGTKFIREAIPSKITKLEDGKLEVSWQSGGEEKKDIFDTVIAAVGREADTKKMNLEAVGVRLGSNGKIVCPKNNDQSSVKNIYAIGDVVQGMPELTPVAIQAGKLLAARLYGGATETMDYDMVPTTVFTPLEYGTIGLSEEAAIERYGQEDIEVYHKEVAPLEWALVQEGKPGGCARCKLVCVKSENMRVVGLHVLSPNAGEVTQGFAVAMRKGATFHDFSATVGIHPTVAEDFLGLTITKASGEDASAENC